MLATILKRLARRQLFGPAMLANPYPYYARLRRIAPVHWEEHTGGWVLTRYADIVSVLRSPHASAERMEMAHTSRVLKADLSLGGKQLRAGQTVLLLLGAANRDPAQFPNPNRLDVGRTDNKHLAFGLGAHFCLGAPLARLEGRIVFETLLRRLPGLQLAGSAPVYRQNFNLRGLEALEVAF